MSRIIAARNSRRRAIRSSAERVRALHKAAGVESPYTVRRSLMKRLSQFHFSGGRSLSGTSRALTPAARVVEAIIVPSASPMKSAARKSSFRVRRQRTPPPPKNARLESGPERDNTRRGPKDTRETAGASAIGATEAGYSYSYAAQAAAIDAIPATVETAESGAKPKVALARKPPNGEQDDSGVQDDSGGMAGAAHDDSVDDVDSATPLIAHEFSGSGYLYGHLSHDPSDVLWYTVGRDTLSWQATESSTQTEGFEKISDMARITLIDQYPSASFSIEFVSARASTNTSFSGGRILSWTMRVPPTTTRSKSGSPTTAAQWVEALQQAKRWLPDGQESGAESPATPAEDDAGPSLEDNSASPLEGSAGAAAHGRRSRDAPAPQAVIIADTDVCCISLVPSASPTLSPTLLQRSPSHSEDEIKELSMPNGAAGAGGLDSEDDVADSSPRSFGYSYGEQAAAVDAHTKVATTAATASGYSYGARAAAVDAATEAARAKATARALVDVERPRLRAVGDESVDVEQDNWCLCECCQGICTVLRCWGSSSRADADSDSD